MPSMCGVEMVLTITSCLDRSDGSKWECKRQDNGKRHKTQISIRKSSKKAKRYHVEGQLEVFGGITGEESRKCFLVAAEKRDEATLLPIIPSNGLSQAHYSIRLLESKLHGYVHRIVNQSKEFVDEDGDDTNKIEGHGSQAMCKMPKFEVGKHISSYLADFMWRYMHKTRTCSKYF